MALEIPGIYVRTDKDSLYVFDHVEARIAKADRKRIVLSVSNPTAFDATVTVLAEDGTEAARPLGDNAFVDWNERIKVKAGQTVNYTMRKSR